MYLWIILIHKLRKEKTTTTNKQKKLILEQARLMGLDMAVGSVSEIDKMKYHKSIFQLC